MRSFKLLLRCLSLLTVIDGVIIIEEQQQQQQQDQQQQVRDTSRPVTVNIQGFGKAVGRREGGNDVWRGIPYATPPIGSLRFAPPEPPQPWAPTKLDATRYAPDCWQSRDPGMNPLPSNIIMSEDCLYLNVWTPAGHTSARSGLNKLTRMKFLPVMVIHVQLTDFYPSYLLGILFDGWHVSPPISLTNKFCLGPIHRMSVICFSCGYMEEHFNRVGPIDQNMMEDDWLSVGLL
jgi:hypothetical protein